MPTSSRMCKFVKYFGQFEWGKGIVAKNVSNKRYRIMQNAEC